MSGPLQPDGRRGFQPRARFRRAQLNSSSKNGAWEALSVQTTSIAAKFLLPEVRGVAQIGDQGIVFGRAIQGNNIVPLLPSDTRLVMRRANGG